MTTADKTLERMRNNPRDWRIDDLKTVAARHGVNLRQPGGSHVVFEHPALPQAVTVPAHKPIKPIYVQQFVTMIDALRREGDE
jgi:predicted RNA binding protein YcfA (HicA-like mRNA interferase family)